MALQIRKPLIVLTIVAVILLANVVPIACWLDRAGLVDLARYVRSEYLTGTAIAVTVALLSLLPSTGRMPVPRQRRIGQCPVCDGQLRPGGRYCADCGSRV